MAEVLTEACVQRKLNREPGASQTWVAVKLEELTEDQDQGSDLRDIDGRSMTQDPDSMWTTEDTKPYVWS